LFLKKSRSVWQVSRLAIALTDGKVNSHMQSDDQQDVNSGRQGNSFEPLDRTAEERAKDKRDDFRKRVPGGQQAAGQGRGNIQQQGQQDGGQAQQNPGGLDEELQQQQRQRGLGGQGEMLGSQS